MAATPEQIAQGIEAGITNFQRGDYLVAELFFEAVLAEEPDNKDALTFAALLNSQKDEHDKAIERLKRAIELEPTPTRWCSLGQIYQAVDKFDEANQAYGEAHKLDANYAPVYAYTGNMLAVLGRHDEALPYLDKAIKLDPNLAHAYHFRGNIFAERNDHARAAQDCVKAMAAEPTNKKWHFNYALALLFQGDWQKGFHYLEDRFEVFPEHLQLRKRALAHSPDWKGEDLDGKSVLIYCTQGLGDLLQMVRFSKTLADQGARVVVCCDDYCRSLFETVPGVAATHDVKEAMPKLDYSIDAFSLPYRVGACPSWDMLRDRYLLPKQHTPLPHSDKFKVGICWCGGPTMAGDFRRSFYLKEFEPLAKLDYVQLYSLVKDTRPRWQHRRGTVDYLQDANVPYIDLAPLMTTAESVASMIDQLDLVITVDTSIAHFSGGLGQKTLVLLGFNHDWRWGTKNTTVWYPNSVCIRQKKPDDWQPVIKSAKEWIDTLYKNTKDIHELSCK